MSTKYKSYFNQMIEENKQLFDKFSQINEKYMADDEANQEQLNEVGKQIVDVVRDYEEKLCRNTERGMYSGFSGGLAEKFQELVRKTFPAFDFIGVKITKPSSTTHQEKDSFTVKRIRL